MIFREVEFGSDEYRQMLALRESVLRTPIGLSLSVEDVAGEDQQMHFAMLEEGLLIACVLVKPLSDGAVKLRQMAVSPAHQGRSIGRRLISAVEAELSERGCHGIEMSARQSAIGFYEKLGYQTAGSGYIEQGIPHVRMVKRKESSSHTAGFDVGFS
ncbi:MAG: GNAT family N-acetyltransferase [Gammaproteobacteria bacterium]|nr:GNAT family N-acetyltransferase [Gammaproteobacteria bacterium]MDP2348779.1 GNAT family N-acetyltransferase [Gammaproteobacteria bacterium]